jgi:dTMP kinase
LSLFISFEGCDGTGKTTQAGLLEARLADAGYRVILVKEPGSTRLGDYLRSWLKDENNKGLTAEGELFLFAAARSALVTETLRPLLEEHRTVVIADRYIDSTTAYQGYGRRLDLDEVARVNRLATGGLTPDITILLDGPVADTLSRVGTSQLAMSIEEHGVDPVKRLDGEGTRRFKEESVQFHERVRRGYIKIAQQDPARIVLIDASDPIQEVADAVFAAVGPKLPSDSTQASTEDPSLPLWEAAETTSIAESA